MKITYIILFFSVLAVSCGGSEKNEEGHYSSKKEVVEELKVVETSPEQERTDYEDLLKLDERLIKNDLTIDQNVARQLYKSSMEFAKHYPNSEHLEKALDFAAKGAENIGDYEEAVVIYHQLINDIPESNRTPVYMYNKGKILEEKINKKDAAKVAYKELIKRYPRNPLSKSMKSYLRNGLIDMTKEEKIKFLQEHNQE